MTAPKPTLLEQATIDRLGVFDEEAFTEIVSHADDPTCDDSRCVKPATHTLTCTRCHAHVGIVCTSHARAVERSTLVAEHEPCGGRDMIRNLIEVSPL